MTAASYLNRPLQPFYLQSGNGRCFALFFPPEIESRKAMLVALPFGEEMNRCRPMITMQARRLAERGVGCLLVDYRCTGDSSGDFQDADWTDWKADLEMAGAWLVDQGYALYGIWGIRLGALLAAQLCREGRLQPERLLFWQPVVDGRQMMTQFLRIRIAAQMDRGEKQENTKQIRTRLANGELVEIAGYELNGSLASAIDAAKLIEACPPKSVCVDWIEARPASGEGLARASEKVIDAWRKAGIDVQARTFEGPPFWQLHKREMAPDIIDKTLETF